MNLTYTYITTDWSNGIGEQTFGPYQCDEAAFVQFWLKRPRNLTWCEIELDDEEKSHINWNTLSGWHSYPTRISSVRSIEDTTLFARLKYMVAI